MYLKKTLLLMVKNKYYNYFICYLYTILCPNSLLMIINVF